MYTTFLCNGFDCTKKAVFLYYNNAYYTYNSSAVEDIFTSVEHWIEFITDEF